MLEAATEQLATIAGQRPNVRRARKSIAAFKLREGMPVGVAVTLRGARMWEFLDRLISIAIPRIRDFRGLNPRSFDGRGNYSMGVREQLIFPEIDYDSIDEVRGLDVTITTTAADRRGGLRAAARARHAVRRRRAAPAQSRQGAAEEEEEQRKEEARLRAEAEQAALEQLKEENPEAYAKPERARGGRGGRGRRRRGRRRRRATPTKDDERRKRVGDDGQDFTDASSRAQSPSSRPATTTAAASAGARAPYYRKFGLCRICLREAAHKGYVPGMTKSSW